MQSPGSTVVRFCGISCYHQTITSSCSCLNTLDALQLPCIRSNMADNILRKDSSTIPFMKSIGKR